jgi:AAHS family 4-hydroxybenzoate transporter-like MFS transporter
LFEKIRRRDTIALWAAFCLCLYAVYAAFSWLPTAMTSAGLNVATAGQSLTAYNMGGVLGALLCAQAITRFGSRWPLILFSAGGALSAAAVATADVGNGTLLIAGIGLHGFFVNAVQSTVYAVCAHVYPTKIRATGTASALMFGRTGAFTAGFLGAAVITVGGISAYLAMLAVAMAGVLVALASVKNHIPWPGPRHHLAVLPDPEVGA